MKDKPTLLCWITCDTVHLDPDTNKHSLLGIFSSLVSDHFPFSCRYMIWFLTVTDCQPGEHRLCITMGNNPVDRSRLLERTFIANSPAERISLVNEIQNMSFMRPGDYKLSIEVDGHLLLETSIIVIPA